LQPAPPAWKSFENLLANVRINSSESFRRANEGELARCGAKQQDLQKAVMDALDEAAQIIFNNFGTNFLAVKQWSPDVLLDAMQALTSQLHIISRATTLYSVSLPNEIYQKIPERFKMWETLMSITSAALVPVCTFFQTTKVDLQNTAILDFARNVLGPSSTYIISIAQQFLWGTLYPATCFSSAVLRLWGHGCHIIFLPGFISGFISF
jgi:hypothetical protein